MSRRSVLAAAATLAALISQLPPLHAADLLRRAPISVPDGGQLGSASTDTLGGALREQTLINNREALTRTNRTLQDLAALQANARAAARATTSGVPNGLATGGLMVAPGALPGTTLWQGANAPAQTTTGDGLAKVRVTQTAAQALLTWQTFNVGRETELTFDQSAGGANRSNWIAFNKIVDPSGAPSQILGSLKADGQVYVINLNGIVFGGASQLNVRGLTASALPLNSNLVDRGLLNNPDGQFLFSALNQSAGPGGTPASIAELPPVATGRFGDIVVEAGATLRSPLTADGGGRITLAGANVSNAGTIQTPEGQTILAAGLQVGFTAHRSDDATLRGLDTYVGRVAANGTPPEEIYAGTVTNSGLIETERGSATLTGRDVKVTGAITSSTSVALNGRIDLLASSGATSNPETSNSSGAAHPLFLRRETGLVEIGTGAVLRILPELESTQKIAASELALRSSINLRGLTLHLTSGATVLAPNALVNLDAGVWRVTPSPPLAANFVHAGGAIHLDPDALISVAGTAGVQVPVSQNIIAVELRGSELADSPLQRNSFLRGKTIYVDIRDTGTFNGQTWIGTPLADATGFAGLIERSVGQLTTDAGTVNLRAGGSIVLESGATIDASSGWVDFQGAELRTTRLLKDGRLIDIADAIPTVSYDAIYTGQATATSPRWGVTTTYASPIAAYSGTFERGYIEGSAGGSVSLLAATMALDGEFVARTTTGTRQREINQLPTSSSLSLDFTTRDLAFNPTFPLLSPTPPQIVFTDEPAAAPAPEFSLLPDGTVAPPPAERTARLNLSPDLLVSTGFGSVTVNNREGDILLPEGTTVTGSVGSALTLVAKNVSLAGSILLPGGLIDVTAANIALDTINALNRNPAPANPPAVPDRGAITVASTARLSTAGIIVNEFAGPANNLPAGRQGGSVSLNAFDLTVAPGSTLDVSGGYHVDAAGRIVAGKAGSISLSGGRDPVLTSVLGGSLEIAGARLLGYADAKATAGSLSILAPLIRLEATEDSLSETEALHLDPAFFEQGGFSSFTLSGIGALKPSGETTAAVRLEPGLVVAPRIESSVATLDPQTSALALTHTLQADGVRPAARFTLRASGTTNPYAGGQLIVRGAVEIAEGSTLATEAGGSLSLSGNTVDVLGSLIAPGGSISVRGGGSFAALIPDPDRALPTVHLGSTARLDAAGATVLVPNAVNLRTGKVLAGGDVSLSGNIVIREGAVIDVSGTEGTLDLAPNFAPGADATSTSKVGVTVPVRIATDGGSITLTGSQLLATDGTLRAQAGGEGAAGGTLSVSSGAFYRDLETSTTADRTLTVFQSGSAFENAGSGIGRALTTAAGGALSGGARFSADRFLSGGFSDLTLSGNVLFEGPVSLTSPGRLRIATGGVIEATDSVSLSAGYVGIGRDFVAPLDPAQQPFAFTENIPGLGRNEISFSPIHGSGQLSLDASLVDIGSLSLQNIGSANFRAASGDIRGNGFLNIAGDLTLAAGQIYPTTGSAFTLTALDYTPAGGTLSPGSITIRQAGSRPDLPASAGGTLSLYASHLQQSGTLRAPFGIINLGRSATDPAPRNDLTGLGAPAATRLALAAGSLSSVSGLRADGSAATLPYGLVLNGTSWIDPRGIDITISGLPEKNIRLSAAEVVTEEGSTIDVRGGGDLLAYRFIPGNGGRSDILALDGAFAVIPGTQTLAAPYAPFNPSPVNNNLGGDPGYVNSTLKIGDQVLLQGGGGLPAGAYTLLPARYANLPGAYLVTPVANPPAASTTLPDGSGLVAGQLTNALTGASDSVLSGFEIASAQVLSQRAEYSLSKAGVFLRAAALAREGAVPRLPADAGRLVFSGSESLTLAGSVTSSASTLGRGAEIDISSARDIRIAAPGSDALANTLTLDATSLNTFGAASLLIGGVRTNVGDTSAVTTTTRNLILDNAGAPLVGNDIILVALNSLTAAPDAVIRSTEPLATGSAPSLTLGSSSVSGSGNGALLRVSAAPSAPITRSGIDANSSARLDIGDRALLQGGSVLLDSSAEAALADSARLEGLALGLNSGRISLILNDAGDTTAAGGLVLGESALDDILTSARSLSLLSYSSIDLFGSGTLGSADFRSLSLSAPALRRFGSGDISFAASSISLDNATLRAAPAALAAPLTGELSFRSETLLLGQGDLALQGFVSTRIEATRGAAASATGTLQLDGDLTLQTPLVTGSAGADLAIRASGDLRLLSTPASGPAIAADALGARLALSARSVTLDSSIRLASGRLEVLALEGDLIVGRSSPARLDVAGVARAFGDQTRVTAGGDIELSATRGSVNLATASTLDLSAPSAVGQAGSLSVRSPLGPTLLDGTIRAIGVAQAGTFLLDAASLPSTSALDATLNAAGFAFSRDYRIRTGDVALDGPATARTYRLAADSGSLFVTGSVNASGVTGGTIDLAASGDLTLADGARLDASARKFSNAGKGGSISLAAGTAREGVVSPTARVALQSGSNIDLSVADRIDRDEALGRLTGTLRLRAPVTAAGTDVRLDAIGSTILDASYVSVEGYRSYDLTAGSGVITTAVQNQVRTDAQTLLGAAGSTTADYTAMRSRLLGLQPELNATLVLRPGAEIIHRTGDLALGTTSSTATSDWNLASFRFGPDSTPGVLTLRAAGDLVFFNALSDGFSGGTSLWLSPLQAYNSRLPVNLQTWDLRLTSGADLGAANFRELSSPDALAADKGSVLIGKNMGAAIVNGGTNALTSSVIANNFQVIRTGSGDIDISAGRDIRLRNPFAAIYTAGTIVANPTELYVPDDFSLPKLTPTLGSDASISQGSLGSVAQVYPVQYSFAGGDVTLQARGNIERVTRSTLGQTIADSSRQLPGNWLYRRGSLDGSGESGQILVIGGFESELRDPEASTTWWVDFSNFFQDVGALGGGDVTMVANGNISNVGAVIPTNARMPSGLPSADKLIELGGGDLLVRAARDIDGGVYYVQRGLGTLAAEESIHTNATRSLNRGILSNINTPTRLPDETWLPTTLFVGDSIFEVSARRDLLLGPVTNAHLLPQGNGNRFWYKTYFFTYSPEAGVNASSLVGDVSFRNVVTLPENSGSVPFLQSWLQVQNLLPTGNNGAAISQPWLRLAETNVSSFTTLATVQPPSLRATSFSGDIVLGGDFNLFPSTTGTIEFLAAGAVDGLGVVGRSNRLVNGQNVAAWRTSRLNLSDSSPAALPGPTNPYGFNAAIGSLTGAGSNNTTPITNYLQPLSRPFAETGATNSVLQTQQALHSSDLLHASDPDPVYLYASGGDLSGLTLFSAKPARITAQRDISDIALYLQNTREEQVSIISAGRDVIAYAPNSALRVDAQSTGNALINGQGPLAGDIQISGPGSLQILAGRNIDLGVGPSASNGTSAGITSVGSLRNPALPERGADLLIAAGISASLGLEDSALDFTGFIARFLAPAAGANSTRYLPALDKLLPVGSGDGDTWTRFQALPASTQARLATEIFYLVLRDAGRDFNNPDSPTFRDYTLGYAAIKALFPGNTWAGDISLTSRRIATAAGGDIAILAPGGQLTVGLPVSAQSADQGILTQAGGNISIFADDDVNVGTSRIFTLRGGDIAIWSTRGDIAAGSAAKTVRSAPPTRVVIDPQSAAVLTDLSGLATGGGIGVLQTVSGVDAGDVDLIAPVGTIDAGDAGIRSAGNLNLAAAAVLNAANIQTGGTSVGAPAPVAAPNLGALTSASATTAVASGPGLDNTRAESSAAASAARSQLPSFFNVEVIGYGGDDDDDKKEKS